MQYRISEAEALELREREAEKKPHVCVAARSQSNMPKKSELADTPANRRERRLHHSALPAGAEFVRESAKGKPLGDDAVEREAEFRTAAGMNALCWDW